MPKQFQTDSTQDDVIELCLPAKYRYLALVRACIRELMQSAGDSAIAEDTIYGVQLAVHEVCNNIIEHAYRHENGWIRLILSLRPEGRTFSADLYDGGGPFDPTSEAPPNLNEPREQGYGLFLARQLMDEVSYDYESGKNHWRLLKTL
jgi:serine/threonine-protein kinase RsbW